MNSAWGLPTESSQEQKWMGPEAGLEPGILWHHWSGTEGPDWAEMGSWAQGRVLGGPGEASPGH